MGTKVDIMPIVAVIQDMTRTLDRTKRELDSLVTKMTETGDITYTSEAITSIANCVSNLRLDLLVTRPIREYRRVIDELEEKIK